MPSITSLKTITGLATNSNPLAPVPLLDQGTGRSATLIADNCVLSRQKMIGNRRGFDYFTSGTPNQVDAMFEYQSNLIEHESDGSLFYGSGTAGIRTQYAGSFVPPSPYRLDGAVGRGSFFFTSTAGIQKIDAITHTPIKAGITKGLDVRLATTGSNGFMNGYSKCAYHVTWARTDANNQQVRGDVSSRVIVTNNTRQTLVSLTSSAGTATATTPTAHGFSTGDLILITGATQTAYNGTVTVTVTGSTTFTYPVTGSPTSPATGTITAERAMNVTVNFSVPWDVQTGDAYEIWRTITKDASNADPGDDCYLVSSTVNQYAAGVIASFTDTTPDSVLISSTPLYTNATQEGALAGNARPPVATTLCSYKDYMIYGNTAVDHQFTENLLAVVNLVAATSKFILSRTDGGGSRTYTAQTFESALSQSFQLYTGGLSNASNIEQTVRSLCRVINGDASGYWYAEYTSGPNDNPGIFRIWARSPLTGGFAITAGDTTTGNQFSPALPTSGQTVKSSNDARPNRLFYSKFQQPDAVPVLNTIDVGRLDQPILRVIALRDACFVIKSDGVFYLSGLDAPFSLGELDSSCHCVAPATCVSLNNQVFFLSNQGVVKVSISGVVVISFDIEPNIMSLLSLSSIATVAFGIAHESERSYILCVPQVSGDTVATQQYVFHNFIQQWTRWTKPMASGIVLNSNYSLYVSSGLEKAVLKQRNNGDQTDYSDEEVAITITAQTGTTVTITWPYTIFTPSAGLSIHQSGQVAKVLSATFISGTTWNMVIDRSVTFAIAAATARIPISSHVRLSPNTCGESGLVKMMYSVSFLLNANTVTQAQIEVATNEAPAMNTYSIIRPIISGWGGTWGTAPWGDSQSPVNSVPWSVDLPIPDCTGESVSAGWIHGVSQEQFIIAQIAITFDSFGPFQVVT